MLFFFMPVLHGPVRLLDLLPFDGGVCMNMSALQIKQKIDHSESCSVHATVPFRGVVQRWESMREAFFEEYA
jgi:hypothetical protein